MSKTLSAFFPLAIAAALTFVSPVTAETTTPSKKAHSHSHGAEDIYKGYFDDDQIKDRPLSDWEGDWQSVYPLLMRGALDRVMQHKAEQGDKSAEGYRAYYEQGYGTDVDRLTIAGDTVTFFRDGAPLQGRYVSDGYEVLSYKKGNRGVRYVFAKEGDDAEAPGFIQFSDHRIAPEKVDHYHLYWGDDRAAVLQELSNWPTYFPADMSADDIAADMMAH